MKNIVKSILMLAVVASFAFACGSKTETTATETTPAADSTETVAPAADSVETATDTTAVN